MNMYKQMYDRQMKEVNAFPMMFAFSNKQFAEGMEKWGLTENDTDKIYSIGNGGFIRKEDSEALDEMFTRHTAEQEQAISEDTTGDGFIFDMFDYELGNHEFSYTGDFMETIESLGFTVGEINADKRLLHGLKKAMKHQLEISKDWI